MITAYFEPALEYGGPVTSAKALAKGLTEAGHEVSILTTDASLDSSARVSLFKPVKQDGFEVYYIPVSKSFLPFYSRYFYKLGCTLACDREVILSSATMTYPNFAAYRIARHCKKPFFIFPHNAFSKDVWEILGLDSKIYMFMVERHILNNAAGIIYSSASEKAAASFHRFLSRALIVPMGLDMKRFESLPQRGILRKRFNIPEDAKVLLFCGRITKWKGLDVAMDAFDILAQSFPNLYFIIAGPDGGSLKDIIKKREKLLNKKHVYLVGLLLKEELLSAYVDADVFIMPSRFESFSNVVAEALACGLPCVISRGILDAPRYLESGVVTVADYTPKEMAKAAALYLLDSLDRKKLFDRARDFAFLSLNNHRSVGILISQISSCLINKG